MTFVPRFADLPDYIVGITHEIWEQRKIAALHTAYAPDIVVRSGGGVKIGNASVIDDTLAKMAAFPDIAILAEDVIWCDDGVGRQLSSHWSVISATHTGHGAFGPPTGRRYTVRCVADCSVKDEVIDDEWLSYDTGDMARQLGVEPVEVARAAIRAAGERPPQPFTPALDRPGPYKGTGNDSEWGQRLAATLTAIMDKDLSVIVRDYDRAARIHHAGGRSGWSTAFAEAQWMALRSSFPQATFRTHHVMGRADPGRPYRAAVRWSLTGTHDGYGLFGAPTGAPVHVMGFTRAEWGPSGPGRWGIARETTLFDETAIWTQILLHTGET